MNQDQLHDAKEFKPRLYILVRDDLPDLSPGKLGAQVSHATNLFEQDTAKWDRDALESLEQWRGEGGGFGTCIVLRVDAYQLNYWLPRSRVVQDTSYPFRTWEGKLVTTDIHTCGWYFAHRADDPMMKLISELELF